jgi:iron complex outermembrane receptor protein
MKLKRRSVGWYSACVTALGLTPSLFAQEGVGPLSSSSSLIELPLDQLTNITISARSPQKLSEIAASVSVITQEDIRRAGATSIAEALRMVPGFDVARIDSSRYAISSRGFNDFFADKLLVLMDGRSAYTPLFSGVFWDVQDTMLEDIDRIEVQRGPGAAMWGANAVNGVVNIITKNSADTQGLLVTGGGGTEEIAFGGFRFGDRVNEDLTYRVYFKGFKRDDSPRPPQFPRPPFPAGGDGTDEWDMFRGGFRMDYKISEDNRNIARLQGDVYSGSVGQELVLPNRLTFTPTAVAGQGRVDGGNVLSSYQHIFSDTSDATLQVYFDRTERRDQAHREFRDTYDLDFQHRFGVGERNEANWGLGYRLTTDNLGEGLAPVDKGPSNPLTFTDPSRHDQLFSGFVQDVITLHPDDLKFTLGTKLEHNSYTGWEVQPNGRLIWEPTTRHSIWAAVSRAVRTPARFEHTIDTIFVQGPAAGDLRGNPAYDSERLMAYETGYRFQARKNLSFDATAFYNDYSHLRVFEFISPGPPPIVTIGNDMNGETYGGELGAHWTVFQNDSTALRLFGGYSLLKMNLHAQVPNGIAPEAPEGESPQQQFQIRSYLDLPLHFQLDAAAYYVDELPARGVAAYTRVDLRLGWVSPGKHWELSIVGQNLLDDRHPEFGPGFLVSPNEIERSVYAKATWRY